MKLYVGAAIAALSVSLLSNAAMAGAREMDCRIERAMMQYESFVIHDNYPVYYDALKEKAEGEDEESAKMAKEQMAELQDLDNALMSISNHKDICAETAKWRDVMNMGPDPKETLDLTDCSDDRVLVAREYRIRDSRLYREWLGTDNSKETDKKIEDLQSRLGEIKVGAWKSGNGARACKEYDEVDKEMGVLIPAKDFKWYE